MARCQTHFAYRIFIFAPEFVGVCVCVCVRVTVWVAVCLCLCGCVSLFYCVVCRWMSLYEIGVFVSVLYEGRSVYVCLSVCFVTDFPLSLFFNFVASSLFIIKFLKFISQTSCDSDVVFLYCVSVHLCVCVCICVTVIN